jgi:uncharacterized repeat protein (TIGR03843 family)
LSEALRLLVDGELEIEGRLVDASNATLYCSVTLDGSTAACVYKPVAGERPLWDFPDGTLAQREVAAFEVSEAAGWGVVPPTVLREGPFGPGMCQLWVETDDRVTLVDVVPQGRTPDGWHEVLDAEGAGGQPVTLVHADDPGLRRMALVDTVINNADRKGGHVLPTSTGHVHGVDHGISFNVDDKLRTVLWGWAGEPLEAAELDLLERLRGDLDAGLGERLARLLTRREVRRTQQRVERLLRERAFPVPGEHWPSIPWPPF